MKRVLLLLISLALSGCAGSTGPAVVVPLLRTTADLSAWEFADPKGWTVEDGALVLHTGGQPSGPIRKPAQYAILESGPFEDVVVEAEVRADAPVERVGRDLLVVVGFQSPTRFYYVHLSNETRGPHNGIFLVNDADRVRIDDMTGVPMLTDQKWRQVRVVRSVGTGRIDVYYSGSAEPVLSAVDHTLTWGRVGFGSFDDPAAFRDVRVVGREQDGPRVQHPRE